MLGLGLGLNKKNPFRYYTNLLKYNPNTWAEWTKDAGVVGDSTGLEFTANGIDYIDAVINTQLKPSTKYGILYNVKSTNMTTDMKTSTETNTLPFDVLGIPTRTVGNKKIIATTLASFTTNRFHIFVVPTEIAGNKAKIVDIRIFELPVGSSIEADFTNLTADQLYKKIHVKP
jgi:hypothetical protein